MKAEWEIRRTSVAQSDGQRRWDAAYQLLLRWAMDTETGPEPTPSTNQEQRHEDCPLCTGLDQQTATDPNH